MAVLADALRTRARGHLGAASLPRHLRRRATSHRPHKLALKRRPNAKRRRALEARGLDPSADGAAAYAFALAVRTKHVRVHWCRAARRRPERARRADVESRRMRTRAITEGRVDESDESDADSDVDHLMAIEDVCGHLSDANAIGDGPPRRLETHLWHAKRFEMRRRWGVVAAERRPGRGRGWRSFDRHARTAAVAHDASHHAAFALVGDRASIDATIRARIDADARAATSSLAFARGEIAVDAAMVDDDGVPVAPVMFLRSSTDDDVAMAWTPAAAAKTVGRILEDAARPRGVETRRADDATTRVEVCGATARAVVDAILGGRGALDGVDGEACEVPRGVVSRVRTAGDPREAAWAARRRTAETPGSPEDNVADAADASDVLAAAAKSPEDARVPATPSEYAAYRASRNARAFGLAPSATSATSAPPASCPLTIVRRARGASALARAEDPGYTLIAPAGWSLPLWLALIHLGARAAGRTEWCWLARRAGAATFPEDFPDHLAAEREFDDDDDDDDDDGRARGRPRGAVPRGKRAVIGANASTDFETLRRGANDVVLRSRDAWAAATKTKTTSGPGARRRRKWTPARIGVGDEVGNEDGNAGVRQNNAGVRQNNAGVRQNPGDARPATVPSSRPGRWVRVLVRCPWGGRPSKGAPVLAPSTASTSAGRRRRVAPDADRRVAIGVVTSVSAPAASVGLASALVNVDALVNLRAGSKSGGGTRVDLRVPSSSPAAVVPATIEVAVESAATDPTWW